MIRIEHGLSGLAETYDAFIVDLWGVLHDGARAFPAAVACLETLHARGKRIVILSNAPRRAAVVTARNAELGIAPRLCDAVMSSGEDTWQHLHHRPDDWYRALGRRCFHLGPERDFGMREGLDYVFVDADEADFVLNTGALGPDDAAEDYDALLGDLIGRGLKMICANPDLEVVRAGRREICAGAIAARYEALGGTVRYHGKPHPEIYRACFAAVPQVPRARIAAIGDSLRTDVAGAKAAGIDAIFVTGGLQGEQLGVDADGNADPRRLAALCAEEGHWPQAALPVLRW